MNPPMIVDRRCPAWNGLAIFGEENSTNIFCPSPEVFEPNLAPRDKMLGIVSCDRTAGLKKNWINVPAATGFRMYGFSGNYQRYKQLVNTSSKKSINAQ